MSDDEPARKRPRIGSDDEDSFYSLSPRNHEDRPVTDIEVTAVDIDGDSDVEADDDYEFEASTRFDRIARAFVRTVIGLEERYQVLNKNYIAKILEAEGEKGQRIQFKRDLLGRIRKILNETFGLDLTALPKDITDAGVSSKTTDEYIVTSILPDEFKKHISDAYEKNVYEINSTEDLVENDGHLETLGPGLPKPATDLAQEGFRTLIIMTVLLNNNNISQRDLLATLEDSFHLRFNETKQLDLLGDITIGQYLAQLVQRGYLLVKTGRKTTDESLLIYGLGRRAVVEYPRESVLQLFKSTFEWDEPTEQMANRTLDLLWSVKDTTPV